MTTYAHDTTVPVARSRQEIDHLLRQWGCDGIQWTDDFRALASRLRFRWTFEGVTYAARLDVRMPPDEVLIREFRRRPTKLQLDARREQRLRSLHRVLLLTIKAQLNAVEAGLVTAVETFLPFLEDGEGRTIAELAVPHLRELPGGSGRLLLGRDPS